MPIYEYQCKKCASNFELLVRNDAEAQQCPECGSKKLGRLLSTFAAQTAEGAGSRFSRGQAVVPAGGCGGPACQMGMCQPKN